MKLKITSIFIVFLCAPILLIAQQSTKQLSSGFYNLTDDPGIRLKLEGTNEYYNVDPTIVASATHITSTKVSTDRSNGKNIPILILTLDASGIKLLNESLNKWVLEKHYIGLIINNKLIFEGRFFGPIEGLKMSLSLGDRYTPEQLAALKKDIDNQ